MMEVELSGSIDACILMEGPDWSYSFLRTCYISIGTA